MRVYILFVQRTESYPGEFAPEAVAAVDEFLDEENEDLRQGLLDEHKARMGDEIVAINWISIDIDAAAVRGRLLPAEHPIKAKLESES